MNSTEGQGTLCNNVAECVAVTQTAKRQFPAIWDHLVITGISDALVDEETFSEQYNASVCYMISAICGLNVIILICHAYVSPQFQNVSHKTQIEVRGTDTCLQKECVVKPYCC